MRATARVFFRIVGLPFYRRLLLPLSLMLACVYLVDASVDWTGLRAGIRSRGPASIAALFSSLFLVWGLIAGHALRPVWRQPVFRFLVRQPIGAWRWVAYLLPPLSIAFLPVAAAWWLAPNHLQSPIHYLAFVGLVWPIMLGASFRGPAAFVQVTAGVVVLAGLIFAYVQFPAAALAALAITAAALPVSLLALKHQIVVTRSARTVSLASISPVTAIVRRDLLCLWRLNRKELLACLPFALVATLCMLAFRINGRSEGREAFLIAGVLLSLSLIPLYEILLRLKTRLGAELMRRRWPIRHQQRAAALLALTGLLVSPNALAVGIAGSSMGAAHGVLFLLFSLAAVTATCALLASALASNTEKLGWNLWLLFTNSLAAFVTSSLVYGALAAGVVLGSGVLTTRGLRRFTEYSSRNSL